MFDASPMILTYQQAPLRRDYTDAVSFSLIPVASINITRFLHVALTFMSIFYKHVFPELEQLRLVMRYIEQRCDRPGHAHWEGHFRFTEIAVDIVIEEKTLVYESNAT